ncbi:MAG: homocysteine S-methyltransferase family protein [Phycisphaera sp.]|nr:homocysteine S-methyltransferase family protein [Phycisphaera sp.]
MLILDGATGTELDRRGVDVTLPLWSARAMIDAPEVLEEIHGDYLRAGADAIVTNTFRTHERSLARAGLPGESGPLTRAAVEIACRARDAVRPEALIFGSVSPLEDCYCPELAPDRSTCTEEHTRMIVDLVDAGVDHVLIETMSSARESLAAVEVARKHAPGRWSVSFCLDVKGAPGHLIDGTTLSELLPEFEGARYVGVNCVPAVNLIDHLIVIRDFLPDGAAMAAYGNVGMPDDVRGWINTDAVDPERYASHVADWSASGAALVGGCCGTSPRTIQAIHDLRESSSHSPGK